MFQAPAMPDIPQPTGLPAVDTRREGRGAGGESAGRPAKRVVETYQEADRVRPLDDKITIIGIPIAQITASTQAALAGLVAENATLRAQVRRLETRAPNAPPLLPRDAFVARLGELLSGAPGPGLAWMLILVHVQTYEDIRRSTGLLAANSALADAGERLRQLELHAPAAEGAAPTAAPPVPVPLSLVGSAGGLSLGALIAAPSGTDPATFSRQVRDGLSASGYDVAGLSMALALKVACAAVTAGESALLALARVDHLTRGPTAVG
jgi:hypothetical protein